MGYMNKKGASVYFLTEPRGEWDNTVVYAKGSSLSRAEEYFINLAREFYETEFGVIFKEYSHEKGRFYPAAEFRKAGCKNCRASPATAQQGTLDSD